VYLLFYTILIHYNLREYKRLEQNSILFFYFPIKSVYLLCLYNSFMLVGTIFSACVGPLVAFSQCGIAYCNVLVMKNIENKIMNYYCTMSVIV